jgi:DNA-binding NarL/FixJ family response regulator
LRAYATAVIAYGRDEQDVFFTSFQTALKESCSSGNADAFVTAYRAFPPLVRALADRITTLDDFLLRPMRTYDPRLAQDAGLIPKELRPPSADGLTEREQEVLELLRQGLSNQQIARVLWIAESTAKVHVRHIFDKLGVRSRTAAAMFERED